MELEVADVVVYFGAEMRSGIYLSRTVVQERDNEPLNWMMRLGSEDVACSAINPHYQEGNKHLNADIAIYCFEAFRVFYSRTVSNL